MGTERQLPTSMYIIYTHTYKLLNKTYTAPEYRITSRLKGNKSKSCHAVEAVVVVVVVDDEAP